MDDGYVKHSNPSVFFDFFCPVDVRVDGVEIVVEALDVVVVDGNDGVVGFSEPEKDNLTGRDGIVTSRVIGKSRLLKVFHKNVGQWAAGGFAHAKSLELLVEVAPPLEVGKVEI